MHPRRTHRVVVVDPLPRKPPEPASESVQEVRSADTASQSSAELDATCKVLQAAGKTAYASLAAYCYMRSLPFSPSVLVERGKNAAKLCRLRRLQIKKVPDERMQFVNAYPVHILDEVFGVPQPAPAPTCP